MHTFCFATFIQTHTYTQICMYTQCPHTNRSVASVAVTVQRVRSCGWLSLKALRMRERGLNRGAPTGKSPQCFSSLLFDIFILLRPLRGPSSLPFFQPFLPTVCHSERFLLIGPTDLSFFFLSVPLFVSIFRFIAPR